jgi:hypothetical protein
MRKEEQMNQLAIHISRAIPEGTRAIDTISACSAIIAYCLAQMPNAAREQTLTKVFNFIRRASKLGTSDTEH